RLEYRRADYLLLPFNFARKSNVDRQELHAAVIASIANAKLGVTKVRSGGRKSRTKNCSDQDRRDRRLTTFALQLSARTAECLSCQRDRVTRIIGQSCGKAVNRRVITGD